MNLVEIAWRFCYLREKSCNLSPFRSKLLFNPIYRVCLNTSNRSFRAYRVLISSAKGSQIFYSCIFFSFPNCFGYKNRCEIRSIFQTRCEFNLTRPCLGNSNVHTGCSRVTRSGNIGVRFSLVNYCS